MLRHEARRRAQAHHAAEGGRDAQRAAEVGAIGQRRHAGGERDGAAAGGAATGEAFVVRVARRSEHGVPRVGPGGELGHVRLADHDRPGRAQAAHDLGIGIGHVIGVDGRAEGGAQPGHRRDVLDGDRDAGEQARRDPGGDAGVEGTRVVERPRIHRDDGVQRRVALFDGGQRVAGDVDGAAPSGGDIVGDRGSGREHGRPHHPTDGL